MPEITPTAAERLLIRRRRDDLTQAEAARLYGVATTRYIKWEKGLYPDECPRIELGRLQPHEACLLARRRAGTTQQAIADAMGKCRWWINQMERGLVPCDELSLYWAE